MFISAKEKNKAGRKERTWGLECRVWIAVLDRVAKETLSKALKVSKPHNVGGTVRTWDSEVRGLWDRTSLVYSTNNEAECKSGLNERRGVGRGDQRGGKRPDGTKHVVIDSERHGNHWRVLSGGVRWCDFHLPGSLKRRLSLDWEGRARLQAGKPIGRLLQSSRQGMVLAWARVVIVELGQILGVSGR